MAIDSDVSMDEVLGRLDVLLNKDKTRSKAESDVVIPLLTEVYTPPQAQEVETAQLLEDQLSVLVSELEEMMKQVVVQAIVELRPKTEALLRQHLLARNKTSSQ